MRYLFCEIYDTPQKIEFTNKKYKQYNIGTLECRLRRLDPMNSRVRLGLLGFNLVCYNPKRFARIR